MYQNRGQASLQREHSHFLDTIFVLEPLSVCDFLRAMLKVLFGGLAFWSLGTFVTDLNGRLQHR
jgi:hypothetical protein